MDAPWILIIVVLAMMLGFLLNRWRYDLVAILGLMTLIVAGVLPSSLAFMGLSHPAVITVGCIMILSHALTQAGYLHRFAHLVLRYIPDNFLAVLFFICVTAAVLSAFMNNIGALALIMPVCIHVCQKKQYPPSLMLMPLAFCTVLGGLTTSIGTPPNLIVAAFREQRTGISFSLFDFSTVGLVLAVSCILFVVLIGWRFLPKDRQGSANNIFAVEDYMTEVKVSKESPIVELTLADVEKRAGGDLVILGLIRSGKKRLSLGADEILEVNDILIIRAGSDDLRQFIEREKVILITGQTVTESTFKTARMDVMEVVLPRGSRLEGRSAQSMRLKNRFNLNILAIAREGKPFKQRLTQVKLRAGDVLLLQGPIESFDLHLNFLGVLPLVEREIHMGMPKSSALVLLATFFISIVLAAKQVLPLHVSLVGAVFLLVLLQVIPVRRVYDKLDGSVLILLAAMIPIGHALELTGLTNILASWVLSLAGHWPVAIILALLMVVTMSLSDLMNNAATAILMAPIAMGIAGQMGVNVDPFLMTVAVGSSCSFLTPIAHQNNVLVMGPGGYHFKDYWRLGLPIELLVLIIGVPAILWIWPL